MQILAFETSAKAASVALLDEDRLIGEYYQNCGQTHSRTLLKMAEDLLENCGRTPQDISAVAAAAGPGSFTGVRIGVAAAKGFAWGANIPCIGISTLEAMAHQAGAFNGMICCAMDARRAQVYHALFECENGVMIRHTEDCAISLEDLEKSLLFWEKPIIFVGDGAQLCYNTFGSKRSGSILAPEQIIMQRASGVALVARQKLLAGACGDGAALTPNYLRLSQAERERAERQKKENMNG